MYKSGLIFYKIVLISIKTIKTVLCNLEGTQRQFELLFQISSSLQFKIFTKKKSISLK